MTRTKPDMHDAHFSPDRRYRYWLEARLSSQNGACMFVMLNPSAADEERSDPTVTRCKGFAERWGYGALWVCNIFALRSTDPRALLASAPPVGPLNDDYIMRYAREADMVVCAWGNHGLRLGRGGRVLRMLEGGGAAGRMYHLGMTKRSQPRHPLYLQAGERPVRFQEAP